MDEGERLLEKNIQSLVCVDPDGDNRNKLVTTCH